MIHGNNFSSLKAVFGTMFLLKGQGHDCGQNLIFRFECLQYFSKKFLIVSKNVSVGR